MTRPKMWRPPAIPNPRTSKVVADAMDVTPRVQFSRDITPQDSACVITKHMQGSVYAWVSVELFREISAAEGYAANLRLGGFDSKAESL